MAVKKTALNDGEGVPQTTIREVALLKELQHPNIVKLESVLKDEDHSRLYLVFELLKYDLSKKMKDSRLGPDIVKIYLYQILLGIRFAHVHQVMHRDLKPQNLLIDENNNLKIADFGLARAFTIPSNPLTQKVFTLWYRPPEVLLGETRYTSAVDIWSIGAIFAEMAENKPLLPGGNTEIGQLYKTFQLFGTPNEQVWPGVSELPDYERNFPQWTAKPLSEEVPSLDANGIDLLAKMMIYDPNCRISAKVALNHPYFGSLDKSLYAQAI